MRHISINKPHDLLTIKHTFLQTTFLNHHIIKKSQIRNYTFTAYTVKANENRLPKKQNVLSRSYYSASSQPPELTKLRADGRWVAPSDIQSKYLTYWDTAKASYPQAPTVIFFEMRLFNSA